MISRHRSSRSASAGHARPCRRRSGSGGDGPGCWRPLAAYLVIASPYLGLARVGITLASDRYSYAPTMAWVVLGCAGLCSSRNAAGRVRCWLGAGAGTLAVACGLMVLCSAQCRVWDSSEHLWGQALEHAEWSSELHHFMGTTFAEEGKLERAIAELHEALRIRPHYFEATYDLGVLLDRPVRPTRPSRAFAKRTSCGRRMPRFIVSLGGGPGPPGACRRGDRPLSPGAPASSRTSPISTSIWASLCFSNRRSTRRSAS